MIRSLAILLTGAIVLIAPAAEKKSLREYATGLQGRYAYGVYIRNQKIGWMTLETRLGKLDGKEVLVTVEELQAELKRGESSLKMEMKTSATYSLEGDGDVLVYEEVARENKRNTTRRGERKGDQFVITTSSTNRPRMVAPPRKNLETLRKMETWLRSGPRKGDTFESTSITLEDATIDTKEVYTFQSMKELMAGGVATQVFHVLAQSKGAISDLEVKADGTPLKGILAGLLEIRTEPEATAKKVEAARLDLLELASIPADRDLGNPDRIDTLTLEVQGLGDYPLPTSPRQQLKPGKEKGMHVLDLKRDFKVEKPAPLSEAERKKMLDATPTVQSDEEKVKRLAKKIVGEETDVHKKAQLLSRWVYSKLRKSFSDNASTTLEILDRMAGDCTEHALLFTSLARSAGIPAREVGGVGYAGPGSKQFGWHAWAEYHDGHQWVAIDPTWNQDRVDATHIKFSDSADDMSWVNVLGKVKFKVVEDKKK